MPDRSPPSVAKIEQKMHSQWQGEMEPIEQTIGYDTPLNTFHFIHRVMRIDAIWKLFLVAIAHSNTSTVFLLLFLSSDDTSDV